MTFRVATLVAGTSVHSLNSEILNSRKMKKKIDYNFWEALRSFKQRWASDHGTFIIN